MTSKTLIDLATRIQRRRDFTAHLFGFLTGSLALIALQVATLTPTERLAATVLIWANALSFQHFRHVLRGPVTTADLTREQAHD